MLEDTVTIVRYLLHRRGSLASISMSWVGNKWWREQTKSQSALMVDRLFIVLRQPHALVLCHALPEVGMLRQAENLLEDKLYKARSHSNINHDLVSRLCSHKSTKVNRYQAATNILCIALLDHTILLNGPGQT